MACCCGPCDFCCQCSRSFGGYPAFISVRVSGSIVLGSSYTACTNKTYEFDDQVTLTRSLFPFSYCRLFIYNSINGANTADNTLLNVQFGWNQPASGFNPADSSLLVQKTHPCAQAVFGSKVTFASVQVSETQNKCSADWWLSQSFALGANYADVSVNATAQIVGIQYD